MTVGSIRSQGQTEKNSAKEKNKDDLMDGKRGFRSQKELAAQDLRLEECGLEAALPGCEISRRRRRTQSSGLLESGRGYRGVLEDVIQL